MQRISRSVRTITGLALASALCAPAAAEEKSTKPRIAVIEFKNQSRGQFEIESSQWGEWVADVERPRAAGRGGDPDRPIITGKVPNASATSVGAAQSLTVGGARTESANAARGRGLDIATIDGEIVAPSASSAQATGKRQPIPTRTRTFATPQPRGSVVLRLKQPWPNCAVGDRFDGVYVMTSATHGYRLGGGEVARCDGRAVTINYTMFAAEGTPTR